MFNALSPLQTASAPRSVAAAWANSVQTPVSFFILGIGLGHWRA